jgi:hypothetical protein
MKALDGLGIVGYLARQELERHLTAETHVLGAIDDTHTAAPNLIENTVMRNYRASHERRIVSQEALRSCSKKAVEPTTQNRRITAVHEDK